MPGSAGNPQPNKAPIWVSAPIYEYKTSSHSETEKQHRSKESLSEIRGLSDMLHHPCGKHLCLFLKTSGIEVKRITEQALEYDHIYAKELSLSNSMDSIYQYMKLMNTSPQ
ncbi:hypothetical protein NXW27_00480 [Phocaeicola dorei]|nr:hypothetical protein [Phocaeicola dorei]